MHKKQLDSIYSFFLKRLPKCIVFTNKLQRQTSNINWQRLVEQRLEIQCWIPSAPEVESNVQFDRTTNGCNRENRKNPSENLKNKAEVSQLDAF